VLGQYVGQSEARLKDALTTADSMAPCVLWIDEIEKGLAGSGTDSTGITTRLVGQFLYWLQESAARVFVVATANDVRSLPQELLRSGRFDDLFFVDLPTPEERRDIIGIYLNRYLRVPVAPEVVDKLVTLSDGFAGSDIEAAVKEIGHEAIRCGDENVPTEFYVDAFHNVVPLSRSTPERIEEVRRLRDRAIPASGAGLDSGESRREAAGSRRVVLG
jgi:SpoVK/Ycf46/Vps4 family AAA+-type ATPase